MAWPSSASENPLAPRVPGDVLVFKTSADAGWELQANLTQIASQNVTLPNDWVSNVALSSDIVVAFGVDGLSCIYTFKRDGASWIFLGKQCVPDDTTSMALGGDLLVLGDYGSQTFQLQGSIWSLVPTAELQGQSSLYKTDGRTLAFLGDVVSVYHWAGSFWSNVATIPAPSNPVVGLGVDVDGDYIIAAWMSFADANYVTVIYEEQGGLWPEVFRINHGDRQPTLVGVSSSGKAVVGRADAYFSTVTIIEVGSNGTWAVTQSFNFDRPYPSAGFASAAISATSLALAEWVPIDAIEQRSVGRILACNSTALSATTSTMSNTTSATLSSTTTAVTEIVSTTTSATISSTSTAVTETVSTTTSATMSSTTTAVTETTSTTTSATMSSATTAVTETMSTTTSGTVSSTTTAVTEATTAAPEVVVISGVGGVFGTVSVKLAPMALALLSGAISSC